MKKLINLIALLCSFVMLFAISGCKKEPLVVKDSETCIVITASGSQLALTETTTLKDYMVSLKSSGLLEFEIKDGMITSINGIANPADWSSSWMLYTSDADNANTAWGEIEYNGKKYGSAVSGAESLIVKEGCLYIWVYTTF